MDWPRWIELGSVVLASLVAVAGLWYSNIQVREEIRTTREGQITDRYTAAVTNLGADSIDVRLGGIYALQRIMQDSPRDQPTIASVLNAYIRTHAPGPLRGSEDVLVERADVYGALSVLAHRDADSDGAFTPNLRGAYLGYAVLDGGNLAGADFAGADLSLASLLGVDLRRATLSANLEGADLSGSNLAGAFLGRVDLTTTRLDSVNLTDANLIDADLTGASLIGARLEGAFLTGASLTGATLDNASLTNMDLREADLDGASLTGARLSGADLSGARLTGGVFLEDTDLTGTDLSGADLQDALMLGADLTHAHLRGADLRGAILVDATVDLTQILSARIDERTQLPEHLAQDPAVREKIQDAGQQNSR